MPREKNVRAAALHKCTVYPYSQHGKGHDARTSAHGGRNDWKDTICPICLEPPHNAVLLLCTSRDKGCHPYLCNTSYRHSNCLDQYRKGNMVTPKGPDSSTDVTYQRRERMSSLRVLENGDSVDVDECVEEMEPGPAFSKSSSKGMLCPLCRGRVSGWKVVDVAREYLNRKSRSCAQESCVFEGTYEELRVHARTAHPLARPWAVDPARQRDWRCMEQQRDLGDVLSSISSSMPTATLFGDYAVEYSNDDTGEDDGEYVDFPGDEGHWWTVSLLFQVFGPTATAIESSLSPRLLRARTRRARAARQGLSRGSATEEDDTDAGNMDNGEQSYGSSRRQQH